jgi:signal transduction histidine kinase
MFATFVVALALVVGAGLVLTAHHRSFATVADATRHLAVLLALGLPVLVGLVAVTTWWVTGRALRPVEAIRSEVATIEEAGLHRRVPEPSTDDEIGRLARTMNAMLARLDEAADRQRRFISDASHELQSPLTSLRTRLEVDLASPSDPGWRESDREALEEVMDMQRLVDDLLTLARFDAGIGPPVCEPVDLDDLALREAQRLRARHRISVDASRVSAGQTLGDPDQLRRALRNVLDNAERHGRSLVTIAVTERAGMVEVRVSDDGSGVPIEHREHVFQRFSRVDDARTRDGAGTGLGLAIAREIVEAHGGRVGIEGEGEDSCFVLRLPAVPSSG